jgi:hypothetical protein
VSQTFEFSESTENLTELGMLGEGVDRQLQFLEEGGWKVK